MSKRDFRMYQKPKQIVFTKEGLDEVKTKYLQLKDERPAAVEHLKKSRELGDLRENGYYKASRQRLSFIDSEILRLGHMIKYGVVQEKTSNGFVSLGSRVTLVTEGQHITYTIVGRFEADPSKGKISEISPLGSELLGKRKNESVMVEVLGNKTIYTIHEID